MTASAGRFVGVKVPRYRGYNQMLAAIWGDDKMAESVPEGGMKPDEDLGRGIVRIMGLEGSVYQC